jgi:cobalt-precorrin 5A hydrolase/precorrin-3B C17-methyltransferase
MVKPAIFILSVAALPLAKKLRGELDGEIHGPHCVDGPDNRYDKAAPYLVQLFEDRRPIIGLCASGILIRAIAPLLADKRTEPPVIAVAEDGSSAVPLLGGHHGANELARKIATICNGHAAITTASEVRLGFAFDEPRDGFLLANPQDVKAAASAVLAGAPVALLRHHGESRVPLFPFEPATQSLLAEWSPDFAGITIEVTEREVEGSARHLIYHPETLAVGVGCERGTAPHEVTELVRSALRSRGLSEMSVACYASIDLKEDEPAIYQLGYRGMRFFTGEELRRERGRIISPSDLVERETGTPSVAEAAALAAAGPDSKLIVAKTKSKRATCAIARAHSPMRELRGRTKGCLFIVGVGPGDKGSRSRKADQQLRFATDWVGYSLYLDLIADLKEDHTLHPFPIGAEEERARHAIELAKRGKWVALVCSGDAGIYAMASLVYEIIDLEPCRIEVQVTPGISAFQAAAAKAGAMIGHDFCCISLSDLLTPWDVIERRIEASAKGDFVVAFYNPRSLKRRDQLEYAIRLLSRHRTPSTPVVIASNLGREEEKVRIVPLSDFDPETVDMLTLVLVGSSQSKSFKRGDGRSYAYTPRGYSKKRVQT